MQLLLWNILQHRELEDMRGVAISHERVGRRAKAGWSWEPAHFDSCLP